MILKEAVKKSVTNGKTKYTNCDTESGEKNTPVLSHYLAKFPSREGGRN
jgi:hypothetical protein